jgi:hypothetical protein
MLRERTPDAAKTRSWLTDSTSTSAVRPRPADQSLERRFRLTQYLWRHALVRYDRRRGSFRDVAEWDDVRRIALALPESSEQSSRGTASWRVREKGFVWERPLRQKEVDELGEHAPEGPILGARVEHLGAKEALLADDPDVYFTTAHFDGYPAVLVRLERIALDELEELIVEAWLSKAPKRLAKQYIDTNLA